MAFYSNINLLNLKFEDKMLIIKPRSIELKNLLDFHSNSEVNSFPTLMGRPDAICENLKMYLRKDANYKYSVNKIETIRKRGLSVTAGYTYDRVYRDEDGIKARNIRYIFGVKIGRKNPVQLYFSMYRAVWLLTVTNSYRDLISKLQKSALKLL